MTLITWSERYSMGIESIDFQHKKIIEAINELNESLKNGSGTEIISKIISGLIDYAQYHFSTEEKYFQQTSYPETETHKMEHKLFTEKVDEFAKEFEKGKSLSLVIEVSNYLWSWLSNHILTQDKKYSSWLIEHGIK